MDDYIVDFEAIEASIRHYDGMWCTEPEEWYSEPEPRDHIREIDEAIETVRVDNEWD